MIQREDQMSILELKGPSVHISHPLCRRETEVCEYKVTYL